MIVSSNSGATSKVVAISPLSALSRGDRISPIFEITALFCKLLAVVTTP